MGGIAGQVQYPYNGKYYNSVEELNAAKNKDNFSPSVGSPSSAGGALSTAQKISNGADYNIDPSGNTSYSNASAQQRETEAMRLKALADARDSFLSVSGGTAGASAPTVQHGAVQGNEQDARANAFRMAKDQAGKIARSSLTSIAENMASRGISGSGIEALRSAGAVQGADQPLQDLTSQQLTADTNRAADISDLSYTGAVAQRGQDLSARSSYLNLLRSLY